MFWYRRRQNVKPSALSGSPWLIGIWRLRPSVRIMGRCAAALMTASPSANTEASPNRIHPAEARIRCMLRVRRLRVKRGDVMLHAARLRCSDEGGLMSRRPAMRRTLLAALVLSLACEAADAQWLNQPTPGLPRSADGKPNLAAPAPRAADGRPDLTGLWQLGTEIGYAANITADLTSADIQ